jgi:hypothetical protein
MNYTLANQNECLIAKYNSAGNFMDLTAINCSEKHVAICRKVLFVKPKCDGKKSFFGANMIEMMLDSRNNVYNRQVIAYKKAEMKDMLERLNQTAAFDSLLAAFFYAPSPCFDIKNITTDSIGENVNGGSSILRYCEWKGIQIECSAIFTALPTDHGMCCTFNMNAAEDLYVKSSYRDTLQRITNTQKMESFDIRCGILFLCKSNKNYCKKIRASFNMTLKHSLISKKLLKYQKKITNVMF